MTVLGSFTFRDMKIEVERLVSRDPHFTVLWLHRVGNSERITIATHRDARFFPTAHIDLGELGQAELGIALERFMKALPDEAPGAPP